MKILTIQQIEELFKPISQEAKNIVIGNKQLDGLMSTSNEIEVKIHYDDGDVYCLFQQLQKAYPWGGLGILSKTKIFILIKDSSIELSIKPIKKFPWLRGSKSYKITSNVLDIKKNLEEDKNLLDSLSDIPFVSFSTSNKLPSQSFNYESPSFLLFSSDHIIKNTSHIKNILEIFKLLLVFLNKFNRHQHVKK